MIDPKNVKIRKASVSDVDRIVRLSNDGGPDGKPKSKLPDIVPDTYLQAFDKISRDSNNQVMVAEIDGEVVGTFQMTFLTYLAGAGRDDLQIESVHVDEKWRSKGVGALMMKWAIDQAKTRGCRRVQLTTNKKRKDAHRFYQSLGFELSHEGAKLPL